MKQGELRVRRLEKAIISRQSGTLEGKTFAYLVTMKKKQTLKLRNE